MINRTKFWDKKILGWEKDRYYSKKAVSKSVMKRMMQATSIISLASGKSIFEVGCGSGILAQRIGERVGSLDYYGFDISRVAIDAALAKGIAGATFSCGTFDSVPEEILSKSEIIISLGVIDWLSPNELQRLAEISKNKLFLHSFSRKEYSLRQNIHKLYTWLYYGVRYKGYVPKYHREEEILNKFPGRVLSFSGMSFGSFITNIEAQVEE